MFFLFLLNFIHRRKPTALSFSVLNIHEFPFFLSFFIFFFLRLPSCIFWDSHLIVSANTIAIIMAIIFFSYVFFSYLLFFSKKSYFLRELLTVLYACICWFSGIYLVNNFFSFIFFIEIISLTIFVVLLNSVFILHNNSNTINQGGLLFSLSSSTTTNRRTFLLNVTPFFWVSCLLSLLSFLIILLLSLSFNYFSFSTLKLYSFYDLYLNNFYFYIVFYTLFLSFLFIKLGLAPFVFWKIQALSSTSFIFMLVYFLFYSSWMVFIFYGLLLSFTSNDVVFKLVLGLFIFVYIYLFFFFVFSTQSVRFFIILSSSLSSVTVFITLFSVGSSLTPFISSIAHIYYLLYLLSSFYLFIFLYQRQPFRVSFVSHFIFLNHIERNFSMFFLLTLVGIPPTSVFFFKLFIISSFFKFSVLLQVLSILFFSLGIILYFNLFKPLTYSFFSLTLSKKLYTSNSSGFLTWGLSLVLFLLMFSSLYVVDLVILLNFFV